MSSNLITNSDAGTRLFGDEEVAPMSELKPRTKRTAKKGFHLSGAHGKYARRDGRSKSTNLGCGGCNYCTPRQVFPIIDLEGGDMSYATELGKSMSDVRRLAYSTESSNYRPMTAAEHKLKASYQEQPEFDEFGRPIVYKTDDAWQLRIAA